MKIYKLLTGTSSKFSATQMGAMLMLFLLCLVGSGIYGTDRQQTQDMARESQKEHDLTVSRAVTYSWSSNGPVGKAVVSIVTHPTTAGVIYAGTAYAGIYASTNGGVSWNPLSADIDTLFVTTIAIDPQNPGIMYSGVSYGYQATGVYRSTNAGANWSMMIAGMDDLDISCIAVDPNRPDTVYAGVYMDWFSKLGKGVFRSINGGASWDHASNGIENTKDLVISGIAIAPSNPDNIYVSSLPEGPYRGGVFKSTDAACSWIAANSGLESLSISCLLVDPSDNTILYACSRDSSIFKSSDGGSSWYRPTSEMIPRITAIAVDPGNSQCIFVGTEDQGVYRSEDGGINWAAINLGLGDLNIRALAIEDSSSPILYAGTMNGVWQCVFSREGVGDE